jgi:hypothetical protein
MFLKLVFWRKVEKREVRRERRNGLSNGAIAPSYDGAFLP